MGLQVSKEACADTKTVLSVYVLCDDSAPRIDDLSFEKVTKAFLEGSFRRQRKGGIRWGA